MFSNCTTRMRLEVGQRGRPRPLYVGRGAESHSSLSLLPLWESQLENLDPTVARYFLDMQPGQRPRKPTKEPLPVSESYPCAPVCAEIAPTLNSNTIVTIYYRPCCQC